MEKGKENWIGSNFVSQLDHGEDFIKATIEKEVFKLHGLSMTSHANNFILYNY